MKSIGYHQFCSANQQQNGKKVKFQFTTRFSGYLGEHQYQDFFERINITRQTPIKNSYSRSNSFKQTLQLHVPFIADLSDNKKLCICYPVHFFRRKAQSFDTEVLRLASVRVYFPAANMRYGSNLKVSLDHKKRYHIAPHKYEMVAYSSLLTLTLDDLSMAIFRAKLLAEEFKLANSLLVPKILCEPTNQSSQNGSPIFIATQTLYTRISKLVAFSRHSSIPIDQSIGSDLQQNSPNALLVQFLLKWIGLDNLLPADSRLVFVRRVASDNGDIFSSSILNSPGPKLRRVKLKENDHPHIRLKFTKQLTNKDKDPQFLSNQDVEDNEVTHTNAPCKDDSSEVLKEEVVGDNEENNDEDEEGECEEQGDEKESDKNLDQLEKRVESIGHRVARHKSIINQNNSDDQNSSCLLGSLGGKRPRGRPPKKKKLMREIESIYRAINTKYLVGRNKRKHQQQQQQEQDKVQEEPMESKQVYDEDKEKLKRSRTNSLIDSTSEEKYSFQQSGSSVCSSPQEELSHLKQTQNTEAATTVNGGDLSLSSPNKVKKRGRPRKNPITTLSYKQPTNENMIFSNSICQNPVTIQTSPTESSTDCNNNSINTALLNDKSDPVHLKKPNLKRSPSSLNSYSGILEEPVQKCLKTECHINYPINIQSTRTPCYISHSIWRRLTYPIIPPYSQVPSTKPLSSTGLKTDRQIVSSPLPAAPKSAPPVRRPEEYLTSFNNELAQTIHTNIDFSPKLPPPSSSSSSYIIPASPYIHPYNTTSINNNSKYRNFSHSMTMSNCYYPVTNFNHLNWRF